MKPQTQGNPAAPATASSEAVAFSLAAAERPSPAPPSDDQLSSALLRLSERAKGGTLTLKDALEELDTAPPLLFCALLALPFCQPVPTIGLSIPFGLGIAFIGMGILFGRKAEMPSWISRRRIPSQLFPLLLRVTARFVGYTERVLKPRAQWVFLPPLGRLWAMVLIVNAICLSLPLPVPLSNTFPAASVLAICLGSLKLDGLAVVAGLSAFGLAIGFLVFLGFAGTALIW